MDKIQISNSARDYFFYMTIATNSQIDDVNKSYKEIDNAFKEIESNISISGININQYLNLYVEDIDFRIKMFENPVGVGYENINIKNRIWLLKSLKDKIKILHEKISNYSNRSTPSNIKKDDNLSINEIAILYYYLGISGSKPITKQNVESIIKEYGFTSKEYLLNTYAKYKRDDFRLNFNGGTLNSAQIHLNRYKKVLPILKSLNDKAFTKAKEEFEILEKKFLKSF